jgi:hypothetical protein
MRLTGHKSLSFLEQDWKYSPASDAEIVSAAASRTAGFVIER